MGATRDSYDAVIVGGGHNGLVAATLLARAGQRVAVLERLDEVGGAAVSADLFPGTGVALSRFAYLVSLFPRWLLEQLGVAVELRRRRVSSYTPGGHIFHGDLTWPWAEAPEEVGRWGVETRRPNLWLCGSGARRGGGVSGIPGHNAATAVLETLGR